VAKLEIRYTGSLLMFSFYSKALTPEETGRASPMSDAQSTTVLEKENDEILNRNTQFDQKQ
jgi:hypothetical protein